MPPIEREMWYGDEEMSVLALVPPGRQKVTLQVPSDRAFRVDRFTMHGELGPLLVEDFMVGKWSQFKREAHPILDLFQGPPVSNLVEAQAFDGGVSWHLADRFDTALAAMNLTIIVHNRSDSTVRLYVAYVGRALKMN